MPAVSPESMSVTSTCQPRASAQRWYMRRSMFAQSHDSVPPAPALMLTMQLLLSWRPLRKTFSSRESSSLKNLERSCSSSCWIFAWATSGSASPSSTITWKSSSCLSALRSGSVLLRRELASSMSFWACSRLFQKFSAAIRALTSPRRFCAPGTSKKPPQMRKFVGRGGQLGCNSVEHPLHGRPPIVGEQVEREGVEREGVRPRYEADHPGRRLVRSRRDEVHDRLRVFRRGRE